jgi:hypothetical protein
MNVIANIKGDSFLMRTAPESKQILVTASIPDLPYFYWAVTPRRQVLSLTRRGVASPHYEVLGRPQHQPTSTTTTSTN